MKNLFKIAIRNLARYKRRTLLTSLLITIGVVFVLVFVAISDSFKGMMIGQITDSMLGHIQIHSRGYVSSIDNLPLTLNMSSGRIKKLEKTLEEIPEIEAYSPRIKFGGMFSNFTETTNVRINGVFPEQEVAVIPLLPSRIIEGKIDIKRGEIIIPKLLANGMGVGLGDMIVVIATNKDGSVNGKQFTVSGILESVVGPGGRDGYMHFNDAEEILRFEELEISEIAIRLKEYDTLHSVESELESALSGEVNKNGKPLLEVHTWEGLSPFYNIARMIDVMSFFIKIVLIAIVLISIMNVMIMAVYERMREIGTIAAIGTMPSKILLMFIIEGFSLGVIGAFIGNICAFIIIFILNIVKISFDFGVRSGLILKPAIKLSDVLMISIIVILVSVLASLQPAYKASNLDPIKALRHV